MPAYDYRCECCDTRFEVTRSFGDTAKAACPSCGASAKRVFTPVGVVFKGSGFHNTDYRKPPMDAASSEKPASDACPSAGSGASCASCPAAD
jgi:putative FmdB family regulatory protein